jgi:threonine synthase
MWRYRELLPLRDDRHRLSMGEGGTPLYPATNLSMMLGRPHLYVKDERQNPTGSFKDRQASLAVSVMREQGIKEMVVASTGNVAISYSAYSTHAGIKLWAFVTSTVPAEKMREVALYGTEVIKVTATYDETKKVATQFAQRRGLPYDRGLKSIAARESMKTVAFEIAEQLGELLGPDAEGRRWRAPDWYIQAVSGGLGPVGVWQGFEELREMGLTAQTPRLACIQATGCAPMVHSFRAGLEIARPVLNPTTRITTVATGDPGAAYPFLQRVIRERGGAFEMATDEEAFRALHVLAKMDGISMESAAALAFAGLFKLVAQGIIGPDDVVVVNCSGHTFPVEKFLLGDDYAQSLEVPAGTEATPPPEEGLLTSLERLDRRVHRVAIIEDHPEAARLLRRVLQAHGEYQIDEAYDGEAGLALVRQSPPDLILLDLMMPKLDGFAFIEALKADERLADIPVIVVTAKDLTAHERQRLDGHVRGLLQKGTFLSTDLLEDIQELLK